MSNEAPTGAQDRSQGAETPLYRIFVRDLVLPCRVGIHRREKHGPQRVRINVELVAEHRPAQDDYRQVLNYEIIVDGIRALARGGHINLVETLAERIIDLCLADSRVASARVGVEKLDIYPEAESVGVVLERRRPA
jgi:dihydroneopterin aldolase